MKAYKLTSTGRTGKEWITYLEEKGYTISSWTKDILNNPDFRPTNGIIYEIEIMKIEGVKTTKQIRTEAKKLGYTTPNAELGCLIREHISDKEIKEMGLWYIVAMHKPIKDSDGAPGLLVSSRLDIGRWLSAHYVRPDSGWGNHGGFAFIVSQGTQISEKIPSPASQRKQSSFCIA